jgi:hypothetical protein
MSPESDIVDDRFLDILTSVIATIYGRDCGDRISQALLFFLLRSGNTWRTLRLLRQQTPQQFQNGFMVDAGALLRCMFDASLQAEFILHDPAKQSERAALYFDFAHVERYKASQKAISHDNPLAERLRTSPHRAEGEKRLRERYDRVKSSFPRRGKSGSGQRDKWYEESLSDLAKAVGREAEYDTFVALFSGCVHSSAFAVEAGPLVSPEYVMMFATKLAARVLNMNVRYNRLELGESQAIMDELCKGVLDRA